MNVQMAQHALDMEEALYLQRQQDLDRDLHVQRFLLQEQLQQEALSKAAASLHASRLYFGGGLGGSGLAAQLQEQEFLLQHQEQLRRQQLQQQILAQSQQDGQAAEQLFAESLTANTIRRSSTGRKRSFDQSEAEPVPSNKRVARSGNAASEKASSKSITPDTGKPKKVRKKQSQSKKQAGTALATKNTKSDRDETVAIEALTAFGDELIADTVNFTPTKKGTVDSLLSAAEGEDKVDKAAATIASLKVTVDSTALLDDTHVYDADEVINLPNFKSVLPRLPSEPEYMAEPPSSIPSESLQDSNVTSKSPAQAALVSRATPETKAGALSMTVEYPYPVDTWWPSITTIRKERRTKGAKSDEEDFNDEPSLSSEVDPFFRADLPEIQRRLATELEPGVLEKFPHCRIHRMAMKTQKVANAPDHAFCWQVTENYCNDPMVCCSVCSTWRHARCGGHYKSMTIRESMETPFVPVCDRCHSEQYILKDFPKAVPRLERQRVEQLRRALATSHVIRQSSFAKHGGTYKWPLGSVSNTHMGGHTRSVHSRHDKAEKQWSEMVTRLSQTSGGRPKERIKVRTRELERLLVSIEDSEGVTDRHNMILFLQQDTDREKPVGYEIERTNIFDPEDDLIPVPDPSDCSSDDAERMVDDAEGDDDVEMVTDRADSVAGTSDSQLRNQNLTCAAARCVRKPRFDSIFCSDGCGVCALELDLMHAFQYANDIHPSLLRS